MGNVNTFIQRMKYWTVAGNLGYDQLNRWDIRIGGECDCSSLVIWALREAGFNTGNATYTGNMSRELTARGWTRVPANGSPQAGDILLNDVHHVAVYLGNGVLAQASIDERGRASGGRAGDQSNRETNVKAYYDYPWNAYLRYTGGSLPVANPVVFGGLAVDGWCGSSTIRRFQQVMGTTVDGVISGQARSNDNARPNVIVQHGSGGSNLVRAVQRCVGVTADGYWGRNTSIAMQHHLGVTADGFFGPASVRALQNRLNTNQF